MKILVTTSTLKQDVNDSSPEFINNLIEGMSNYNESTEFTYLYPYKGSSPENNHKNNILYKTYKYWFSKKGHDILNLGIYQSIKLKKINILKVIFLIISQFFSTLYFTIKLKPDYIYAHWVFPQGFLSSMIGKITNTKVVFTSHGSDITLLRKMRLLGKFILYFTISNAYKFTVVSEKNIQKINDFYKIEKYKYKSKIIPMGINNLYFRDSKIKYSKKDDRKNYLFFGRLTEYKGLDLLVSSFKELTKENSNVLLKIIGYGDMEKNLNSLIKEAGLKNITIEPFKKTNNLIKEIDNADLVIIPSIETDFQFEAGPLSIIEAMARKRLCLVSDSIGFINYLSPEMCLIFNSGNSNSLTKQLFKFRDLSEEEYISKVNSAFKLAQNFNFKNISQSHFNFLFS